MGYNLNYTDIRNFQTLTGTAVTEWLEDLARLEQSLGELMESDSYSGAGAAGIKNCLREVYLPLCQSLRAAAAAYRAQLYIFVHGLYEHDSGNHANINEDALRAVMEAFRKAEWAVTEFQEQAESQMDRIRDLVEESSLKGSITYRLALEQEREVIGTLRDNMGEYEHQSFLELEELREDTARLRRTAERLREKELHITGYESGSLLGTGDYEALKQIFLRGQNYLNQNMEAAEAACAHYNEVWDEIREEISEARIRKGIITVTLSAGAIALTFASAGSLAPGAVSLQTQILAGTAIAFDLSSLTEGAMELHYGCVGDMEHTAWNPIRDTVFGGWQEGYEVAGFGMNVAFGASLANDVLTVRNSERLVAGDIGERASLTVQEVEGSSNQFITNKFSNDVQTGKIFNYEINDGRLIMEQNSIHNMDFVVDSEGNLILGSGHSYLSNGQAVQAAGTLKIDANGNIRGITNWSGHYQPTVSESINYPTILQNLGLNTDKTWIYIDEFTIDSVTNYVAYPSNCYYNGPVGNIPQ